MLLFHSFSVAGTWAYSYSFVLPRHVFALSYGLGRFVSVLGAPGWWQEGAQSVAECFFSLAQFKTRELESFVQQRDFVDRSVSLLRTQHQTLLGQ